LTQKGCGKSGDEMNFLEWLLQPIAGITAQLDRIEQNQETFMATYTEAKQEWVDYTTALQDENEQLRSALTDAQATAQSNADALAAFQADDAQTDAQQLADQEQAFADDLQNTLNELKEPPTEPEPLPEPDPGTGEPPVDEGAHPDQTLPGDLPPDQAPVDPGNPSQAPGGDEPQVNPLQSQ
jgi:hypothetical protein